MKVLITGGAGFIGSHVAELYAKKGHDVTIFDNLSRSKLLHKEEKTSKFNWNYLKKVENINSMIEGDVRDFDTLKEAAEGADLIIHCAAQTGVTSSLVNPREDFETNALGVFNVLEAARLSGKKPTVIFTSTNKVYGNNVNNYELSENDTRYSFKSVKGVPEALSIDHCEHTPYGCSKLLGDLYMQDYSKIYGIKTGVFRMSCIYGTRQFGVEDQGWIAWFTIATLLDKPITIYGDGKQVRDILFVEDLIEAFEKFRTSDLDHGVFNMGGGSSKTISLLELLDMLEKLTGKKSKISFSDWRPCDQKVYVSDINKAMKALNWQPKTTPEEGIKKLVEWVEANKNVF